MNRKLTVLIPCKDERTNIRACLASVAGLADEILVADSGSTDGTLEIVREPGMCRVVERAYIHSGDFKNWAIPQAEHEWVLLLDADERVTPDLAAEIRELLASGPQRDGYWIGRDPYFMGHRIRFSGWRRDRCLRLFRRDISRYVGDTDHAEVEVAGGHVGRLRYRLEHYTCNSYDQFFRKFHRYTTLQANVWFEQGRRPSWSRLLFNGPLRFLRSYIWGLGFLDGFAGLQVSALTGFYSFMKQARLWERHAARGASEGEHLPVSSRERAGDASTKIPAPVTQFRSHVA